MSGGSLDYVYMRVDEAADAISLQAQTPIQMALAVHLRKVAKALHDLEWVLSCDYPEGAEVAAIEELLWLKDEDMLI